MRVLVVGAGGREAAIAWACRQHGHDVRRGTRSRRGSAGRRRSRDPRPRGGARRGHRRRVRPARARRASDRRPNSPGSNRRSPTPGRSPSNSASPAPASPASTSRRRRRMVAATSAYRRGRQSRRAAAGKGVVVPDRRREPPNERSPPRPPTGPFLLEERLRGPECSLLALCDGTTAVALPLAQDHKRIGEADTGPNTGGMGAYAPAPVPYAADELAGHVRPAGARPLRRRGHAVRRRDLRRPDAAPPTVRG